MNKSVGNYGKKALGLALVVASLSLVVVACTQSITGAGASFPAPLYSKWSEAYKAATKTNINYQSIGSGGGIKQIKAGTVDFGASDKPLTPEELKESGLYQFPTVLGGVVPVINLTGFTSGQIKLSGTVLADIFLGKIKKWDDPAIVALNPELKMPNEAITVVHRSDGSGTSFIFTHYLAGVSAEWKEKIGVSDTLSWPVGIGGKGNEGVANFVKTTQGAIGYVEYAYAIKGGSAYALLQNTTGEFIKPDVDSFKAAAGNADWAGAKGNYLILTNQPGANSWPITGATFIVLPQRPKAPKKTAAVLAFFDWAYRQGDADADALHYVSLPDAVEEDMRKQWDANILHNNKPVYSPKG